MSAERKNEGDLHKLNITGRFLNWLADELNERPNSRRGAWILHRLVSCPWKSARRSAGWVIQEQADPSALLLEWQMRLLRDPVWDVRLWAAMGLVYHPDRLTTAQLATADVLVREMPLKTWNDPTVGAQRQQEILDAISRELHVRVRAS